MTQIALFHSVLGLRPGVTEAAERLRAAGHEVLVVDQYSGTSFDDYVEAAAYAESISYPELMRRAVEAVQGLPDGLVAAGFSNGGAMAEHVATQREVAGVVMLSGALPLELLGVEGWPAGVPAQIHFTADDPHRQEAGTRRWRPRSAPRARPSRSSSTRAAATCSPTRRCPRSTSPVRRRCSGSACWPSRRSPGARRERGRAATRGRGVGSAAPAAARHPADAGRWQAVAEQLRDDFTVVRPDPRGYGDSAVPPSDFSKRAMAADALALMRGLGHERFAVAGHDRRGPRGPAPDAGPPRGRQPPRGPRHRARAGPLRRERRRARRRHFLPEERPYEVARAPRRLLGRG